MGTGSHRYNGPRGSCGRPIFRAALIWAICGTLLAGCKSLEELNTSLQDSGVWPFTEEEAPETADATAAPAEEPVTAAVDDEVALDAALVAKVQGQLTDLGYQPGPVDGAMGPKTRGAIRRYQVVEGLSVDGLVTETFLARLEESAAAQPAAPDSEEAAIEPESDVAIAPAALGPQPTYEVGSRYVYADGEIRTVLEIDGPQVYWQSNETGRSMGYENFLIPPLAWMSPETSGKRSVDVDPDGFWPREDGTQVALLATSKVEHRSRPDRRTAVNETWHCRDDGGERLSVMAGDFQTRRLVCEGTSEPDGTQLQRVWHYAPDVRHYVLFQETSGSRHGSRRSELLAIVPSTEKWPPAARAGLGWALTHTLETAAPGEATDWTSSAIDVEVTIVPGPRAASDAKTACRDFVQTWSGPEGSRAYPGLACRQADGQWLIPGLESDVEVAEGADE